MQPTTEQVRLLIEKITETDRTESTWLTSEFIDELANLGNHTPPERHVALGFAIGFACGQDYEQGLAFAQHLGE